MLEEVLLTATSSSYRYYLLVLMLQLLEQVLLASTFNVQLVSADMTPEFSESNSESNIFSQRVTICTQIILSLLKTVNPVLVRKSQVSCSCCGKLTALLLVLPGTSCLIKVNTAIARAGALVLAESCSKVLA